ncbi:MAG: ion transporter [Chloracidobacterium sp.]|nr:ion transporter [Chloracidobacterium sp.]MDW8217892.1 ion transporter [Acidobacteriota bacterium]
MPLVTRDHDGQISFGKGELFIQAIIFLSLADFTLETLPNLTPNQRFWLEAFEIFSVSVFTVEYLVRVCGARPIIKYLFSFYGVVDLLAILPFYVGLTIDLRSVRSLRFLRLLRILKLARYSRAMRRFHRALLISKEELLLCAATALILIYLAAVGIYYFEHEAQPEVFTSMFDGLWWAVATLTTVGYGDSYPVTAGGRFFTFVVLVIGLGIVALPSGIIASALSKARQEEETQGTEASLDG